MAKEMFISHIPSKLSSMKVFIGVAVAVCVFGSIVVADNKTSSDRLASALPPMKNNAFKRRVMESLKEVSLGNEQFSLEFLKRLSAAVSGVNYDFIVSPFSIWSLLLLVAEGADGNTHKQLQKVLRLPEDLSPLRMSYKHIQKALNVNTSGVEVAINQALFSDVNRPIGIEYADTLERVYDADHLAVNFYKTEDALGQINQYVSKQTRGKINNIVNADDLRDAQLLLISALFFRGAWKVPFNVNQTKEEPFYNEYEKLQGNVNMMFQSGPFLYSGIRELDASALELPYGDDDRMSMIILLPEKGTLLTSVLDKLSALGIEGLLSKLQEGSEGYEDDVLEVLLPRFSITADFTLNVILEQMGLTDIFDVTKANLSKISRFPTYLSRIIHKAQIDVNEVGTVASAITAATLMNKSSPPRFYANHPFAFLIIEKNTNTLLFCGQVRNPGKVDFKPL